MKGTKGGGGNRPLVAPVQQTLYSLTVVTKDALEHPVNELSILTAPQTTRTHARRKATSLKPKAFINSTSRLH